MKKQLIELYKNKGNETYKKILNLIKKTHIKNPKLNFTQKDTILVIYPNQIKPDLKMLYNESKYFKNFSYLHILPFFPYSVDRGFSIINFNEVSEKFGNWKNISKLKTKFNLMFDFVLNHVSPKHQWFKDFLKNKNNYFISYDKLPSQKEIHKVFRPRTTPLFTKFKNKYIWTTFGREHIDLNYENPEVLIEMVKILLNYIKKGVRLIRLDAIAFIWKQIGKKCIHEKQAHLIVQIFRDICNKFNVSIITETNVPHKDNISYLKNNEANAVYNFSLPPLVLYSFYKQNSYKLLKFVEKLKQDYFINFLDTHDGIGVLGAESILTEKEFDDFIKEIKKTNVIINYKTKKHKKIPYEIASTWFNLLPEIKKYIDSFNLFSWIFRKQK
jgi:sucrose phosphorylase